MRLWQGLLSRFHLTKLDGSAAWLCYLLLLPCSSRRPLGIAPSSARQPLGRFRPSSACRSPVRSASGLRLPDTPVCCGCRPFQRLSTRLSVSLGSRMMAKVRTSVGFALPASSFAEASKFESIAVCGTFLSFRHRLGVFWMQKSSETYYLLLLGSSR